MFAEQRNGYVCSKHSTLHRCSSFTCTMIYEMVDHIECGEFKCPILDLVSFRKPDLEYGSSYCPRNKVDSIWCEYGSLLVTRKNKSQSLNMCVNIPILKTGLPVLISLFTTLTSIEFIKDYEIATKRKTLYNCPHGTDPSRWMSVVIARAKELAAGSVVKTTNPNMDLQVIRDIVTRSTVAMISMFETRYDIISRFMRRVMCKHQEFERHENEFYIMIIMATLCCFPYLHHELCTVFDVKILVNMYFDKRFTKHNQWSTLSTYLHQHANRTAFQKRVLRFDVASRHLPVIIKVTLNDYLKKVTMDKVADKTVTCIEDDKDKSTLRVTHMDEEKDKSARNGSDGLQEHELLTAADKHTRCMDKTNAVREQSHTKSRKRKMCPSNVFQELD